MTLTEALENYTVPQLHSCYVFKDKEVKRLVAQLDAIEIIIDSEDNDKTKLQKIEKALYD